MTRPSLNEALISVVLPIYNEADVLEELQERVHRALLACGTGQEIIFVNDGSTDPSPQILDALAARYTYVRVIHLARNFGHQAAVHAGLCHARGDAVVLMDSDLQDSPEAIGRLVAEWATGYDVVYAQRSERPEAAWKRLLFATFHRILSCVASAHMPCDAGNFSIIDARVVRELVALGERDRYLPGLRSWVGFKQRGIDVRRERRYDDRPRVPLAGLWRLAKTAIFSFSSFPLTLFYVIGYTALAAFLMLGTYALYCKAFTALAIPGWTSNVLVASFFGAVNSLGICILGEYVIRIYDQVRGRPLFLIDQTRNLHQSADNHWPDDESNAWPSVDRRIAAQRRAKDERRGNDRRAADDRRASEDRGAVSDWSHLGADIGAEDYLAFAAEFESQSDLATADWRTNLESDEDYQDLMAEAEALMALVTPAATNAKLHVAQPHDAAQPVADPMNQDPLNSEALNMEDLWFVGEQSPSDAQRKAADARPVADEQPARKRSNDRPQQDRRQTPETGPSPKAEKTGRRSQQHKGKDRRGH